MSFNVNVAQDKLLSMVGGFDKELNKYGILRKIENQTGIPKSYGTLGFVAVYFVLIFANVGGIGQLLANLATLVVPGYFSLIALETPGKSDDTHYLTYWVVYAAFSVVEFWSGAILYWIPFYWFIKTIVFLYLGLPNYGGARWVYLNILQPFAQYLGLGAGASPSLKEKVAQAADVGSSTSVDH